MTPEERKFLNFLNSIPEDIFDQWLAAATPEQIALADRLYDEVKASESETVEDLSEATNLLKQFTLKD